MPTLQRELETAVTAAKLAGEQILPLRGRAMVRRKSDSTPVTDADLAADRVIRETISNAFPFDALLTEESADDALRLTRKRCWIVDPIDGTSSFIDGTDDFDVLIALVTDGRPIVAISYQPVTGLMLGAVAGEGAWLDSQGFGRRRFNVRRSALSPVIATKEWLGAPENLDLLRPAAERLAGSIEVETDSICIRSFLDARTIDMVVGYSPAGPVEACYWDICAIDLILSEAGGHVSDIGGDPLRYDAWSPHFPRGLVLSRDADLHRRFLGAFHVG